MGFLGPSKSVARQGETMAHLISVHSFRGGTGKSNASANLAAIYAKRGFNVGVLDTDIQSPGIHVLFNVGEDQLTYCLNDFLWGQCTVEQTAHDVSAALGDSVPGRVLLVPSRPNVSDIARVLHDGYDVNLLSQGFRELIRAFSLDVLIIDTHPGLNEETLLSIAVSSAVLLVMRPDHQDYQGTGLAIEVARELQVPRMMIMVNKVPEAFQGQEIREMVEEAYGCPVAALVPHSDEIMTLASQGLFAVRFPEHPITAELEAMADALIR